MSDLNFYLIIKNIYLKTLQYLTRLLFNKYKNTNIAYRSGNFVIIDKAYDLKINSNDKDEDTIQTFMKQQLPFLASNHLHHEYHFMHRLDYSTSGLMCIPIHKEACQVASKALQERQCKKYYVAFVRGYLSSNLLDLNYPIGIDTRIKEIVKMCVTNGTGSRSARTLIVALESGIFDSYPTTKILIRPITGRRHQIRVHCSHIGHTIVGDYTYSNKKDVKPERMYLHALRLIIPNKIEDINRETKDPFNGVNVRHWRPFLRHLTLSEGFEKIDTWFL